MSLSVISNKDTPSLPSRTPQMSLLQQKKIARQAELERYWKNPPPLSPLEQHRLRYTADLLSSLLSSGNRILDLGAGNGTLTEMLANPCWDITCVDAATNALALIEQKKLQNVHTQQAIFPACDLKESSFDVVIACNFITEFPFEQMRLVISDIEHILRKDGIAIITAAMDTRTENPTEHLIGLLSTSFTITDITCTYAGIQARWLSKCRYLPWLEKIGSLIPERNRDYVVAIGRKKPLF